MTAISLFRGEDKLLTLTITDDNDDAQDLTDATGTFTVVRREGETALITKNLVITDEEGGICTVTLTDTDTTLSAGRYIYVVELIISGGAKYTALKDDFIVKSKTEAGTYYNTIEEVRDALDLTSAKVPDEIISRALSTANRKTFSKVGAYLTERIIVSDEDSTTMQLRFNDIRSITAIYKNGTEISSDNYSLANSTGVVTFSGETFYKGNIIEATYVPTIFADLELMLTERILLRQNLITRDNNTMTARIEELDKDIMDMVNDINGNINPASAPDHKTDLNYNWYY